MADENEKTVTGRTPSRPPLQNIGPAVTPEQARQRRVTLARLMWGGFYRCPTTGRILEALPGDDKVLCPCRQSNPKVLDERTEQTNTHIIRFLTPATAEEYVDQQDAKGYRWP